MEGTKEGSPLQSMDCMAMETFIARLAHKSQMYVIRCHETYT